MHNLQLNLWPYTKRAVKSITFETHSGSNSSEGTLGLGIMDQRAIKIIPPQYKENESELEMVVRGILYYRDENGGKKRSYYPPNEYNITLGGAG